MRRRIGLFFLMMLVGLSYTTEAGVPAGLQVQPWCSITPLQWQSPDHNRALLSDPALRSLLKSWIQDPSQTIRISFPPGPDGDLWAARFSSWLTSFGVPSDSVVKRAGHRGQIDLNLTLLTVKQHS